MTFDGGEEKEGLVLSLFTGGPQRLGTRFVLGEFRRGQGKRLGTHPLTPEAQAKIDDPCNGCFRRDCGHRGEPGDNCTDRVTLKRLPY